MKKVGATAHLLITLDDIAWLLNFRGRDVAYMPVVLSYAVVTMDCVHLFVNDKKIGLAMLNNGNIINVDISERGQPFDKNMKNNLELKGKDRIIFTTNLEMDFIDDRDGNYYKRLC